MVFTQILITRKAIALTAILKVFAVDTAVKNSIYYEPYLYNK